MKVEIDDQDIERIAEAVAKRLQQDQPRDHKPMLTVSEVAKLLNMRPETVRRKANERVIPCVRFGKKGDRRFPRERIMQMAGGNERGRG